MSSRVNKLLRLAPYLEHAVVAYYAWQLIKKIAEVGPKAFLEKLFIGALKKLPGERIFHLPSFFSPANHYSLRRTGDAGRGEPEDCG